MTNNLQSLSRRRLLGAGHPAEAALDQDDVFQVGGLGAHCR